MSALWVGPVALTGLVVGWIAVQALWRRVFNAGCETDVLADRSCCNRTCHSCARPSHTVEGEDEHHRIVAKEQGHA